MKSLTFIIPLHQYDETVEAYLGNALESIKVLKGSSKNKVIIVGPTDVVEAASELYKQKQCPQVLNIIENNDKTDIFTQVNMGVFACTTKYFSVLEYDDSYNNIWTNCVEKYIDAGEKYSVYLPMVKAYNEEDKYIGMMNEIMWASGFAETLGKLDIKVLETFMDFQVTGGIIKTEDFIAAGGLKPSLKIAAWYEFLLRMVQNGYPVFVVPRLGYNHIVGRKGSYSVNFKENTDEEEAGWLISKAKEEYFFKEDRNIEYKK